MFVAILGDRRSMLPANWTKETAIAIAAEAAFDAAAGAGPGASLTFVGVAGDLVLRVPAGSRVREGGFSLLGDRQILVAGGDGPEIQVRVYGPVQRREGHRSAWVALKPTSPPCRPRRC